ncbi:MAG: phage late control D family protein [Polyangiaceae bacterium]|nr:phage late control D family protein [Polyangiaceae bacterium]
MSFEVSRSRSGAQLASPLVPRRRADHRSRSRSTSWRDRRTPASTSGALVEATRSFHHRGPRSARRGGRRAGWSGLCDEAEQLAVEPAGLSTYRIHIVARIRLLDGRISHRIYTARTALEIVAELLDEWEIPSVRRVERGAYPTHVSRTQYRESDGGFLHRLLEEAGISYTFEDGTCAVVLDDAPRTRAARAGSALPGDRSRDPRGGPGARD